MFFRRAGPVGPTGWKRTHLRVRVGDSSVGDGPTAETAVADLRDALEALLAEVGPPDELTLTLDVA
jgi:uncharacterized protein CbrC (UPF0167 family)